MLFFRWLFGFCSLSLVPPAFGNNVCMHFKGGRCCPPSHPPAFSFLNVCYRDLDAPFAESSLLQRFTHRVLNHRFLEHHAGRC